MPLLLHNTLYVLMWFPCVGHRYYQSMWLNSVSLAAQCAPEPAIGRGQQGRQERLRLHGQSNVFAIKCLVNQMKEWGGFGELLNLAACKVPNQQTAFRNMFQPRITVAPRKHVCSSFSLILWIYEVWTCWPGEGDCGGSLEHCVLSDKRPHGSAAKHRCRLSPSITLPYPEKPRKTPKCPRKASPWPEMGRPTSLEAQPPVHLRCLLWERSPEESGWRGGSAGTSHQLTRHPTPEAWRRWAAQHCYLPISQLSWFLPPSQPLSSSTG